MNYMFCLIWVLFILDHSSSWLCVQWYQSSIHLMNRFTTIEFQLRIQFYSIHLILLLQMQLYSIQIWESYLLLSNSVWHNLNVQFTILIQFTICSVIVLLSTLYSILFNSLNSLVANSILFNSKLRVLSPVIQLSMT